MKHEIVEGVPFDEPETLREIFETNRQISVCTEYDGHYYIQLSLLKNGEKLPKGEAEYNNSIFKIDKKTGKIIPSILDFIGYKIDIEDKATPVDPEVLRKRVS